MNIPPAPRASPVERDAASEDIREICPIAPPTVPEIASAVSMVAGAGVANIDLRSPKVRPVEANVASKNMRGRWLLDRDPAPQRMWIGKLSFVFSLAAIVFGAALLVPLNEVRTDAGGIAAVVSPLVVDNRSELFVQPARLVVQSERGFADEPIPLGVSLVDATGEESLTLIGLVTGSRLSVGTPLGSTGWQLSARTIGNAFIYAPNDFVGVMDVVIDLRSASNQPMDVQVVRFEWIRKKEGYLTPQPDPSKPPPGIRPLDPEEIEARSVLAAAGSEAAQVPQAGEVASQQLRQALEEERRQVAALTGELAAARQEIEARGVLAVKAAGETAEVRQALEEERERVGALTRDLGAARREIEARTALGATAAEPAQAAGSTTVQLGQAPTEERQMAGPPAGESAALSHPTSKDASIPQRPVLSEAQVSSEAKKLLARADTFLSRGDIGAARIVLERALDMGSAEAGFRLAESYDPLVLSARRALGTQGDLARARDLYKRAYEAGIQEAKDRMDALR